MLVAPRIAIGSQALTSAYVFDNTQSASAPVFDQMLHASPSAGRDWPPTSPTSLQTPARGGHKALPDGDSARGYCTTARLIEPPPGAI